jgi:Ser/Thr protein kinase RdoA (MazF antagonist)
MWRIFPFVSGQTLEQIQDPNQAYLAARAFSQLSKACEHLDLKDFQETIPNFHRLDLRFEKLQEAAKGSPVLSLEEIEIRDFYLAQSQLVDWYRTQMTVLPARVTHNDTKINNLIFSENASEVKAVIDLDTLMGGFLLYDFGDLVRTVACSVPETSIDWETIRFSPEIFEELLKGYWAGVKEMASPEEAQSLLLGGEIMTLIMGIRFFTDHLQGNIYYRVSYPEQNFDRAKNQMIYLQAQQANRPKLQEIWKKVTGLSF